MGNSKMEKTVSIRKAHSLGYSHHQQKNYSLSLCNAIAAAAQD